MSGIVGIVNFDGAPVDRDLLTRLTKSMTFRGPDAQQTVNLGQAGFGHTMLRTTWEAEHEKQPLTFHDRIWLTADARIDGRAELQQKLGVREANHNDAELILLAYQTWKEQCIDHLTGDFAFAIWDTEERRLFCARDHFGVKPFFYARAGDAFIFSNTLNTLRLHRSISDELHEPAIADYLLFGLNQDLASTTFRDIHRLPGGHTLTIDKDSIKIRRYWQLAADATTDSGNNFVEQFEHLLTTATRDRLRTNRIGVSMSGGLDSTGLAAIAQDLLREDHHSPIHACTNVYDSLFPDEERRYSALAANALGIPLTQLSGDRYSLFESDVAEDLNQPEPFLLSPLAGQFNSLLRHLAQHSRVALTGYDGDAFMTERPSTYLHDCVRKLRINELIRSIAWYVRTYRALPPVGFRSSLKRIFRKESADTTCPPWIDESFAARVDAHERWRQWNSDTPPVNQTHPAAFRALESKVWASLFEGYDPGSTRLALELRHPFIDVRLLRYVVSLPSIPWCVNKHILRCALSERLPQAILNRPKTPLASNPTLHLDHSASVRCPDRFEVNSQLARFIDLNRHRTRADQQTAAGHWADLRVFALNHWLTHSHRIARETLAQTA
jgi:asparagine synthase (glutamine-hydrolysing)